MTDIAELIERLRNNNWSGNVTDDITRWADSRSEAATALETLQAENERLRDVLGEICTDSNPDWTEKRIYPCDVLDDIHTMAVDAYYHRRAALTGDSQNG